jgi:hypothetical protein
MGKIFSQLGTDTAPKLSINVLKKHRKTWRAKPRNEARAMAMQELNKLIAVKQDLYFRFYQYVRVKGGFHWGMNIRG